MIRGGKMQILAIDQSLTKTGYWLPDKDSGGVITTSPLKSNLLRILTIRERLCGLIAANKIDTVIMEDYAYGARNTRFTFTAGEVGWMIKSTCHDLDIKCVVIPATLLKKFVTGKGNSKKQNMLLACYKKYGHEFDDDNICDAFCLYKFYLDYVNWKNGNLTCLDYEVESFRAFDKMMEKYRDQSKYDK